MTTATAPARGRHRAQPGLLGTVRAAARDLLRLAGGADAALNAALVGSAVVAAAALILTTR